VKGPCNSCGSSDACHTYEDLHTHCFSCGAHSGVAGEGSRPQEERAPTVSGLIPVNIEALPKRSINDETAKLWRAGYGEHHGERCQAFQYVDGKGRVVAQKLKFAGKRFEITGDAKRMGLYGQWLWRDSGRMVVVVEGELDALSVSQIQNNKWPVVSVPNGAPHAAKAVAAASEWLEGFDRVVLLLDDDEVGRPAALECAAVLSPGKAYIGTIAGHKDANSALMAGESKAVIDAIWGAKAWRPDGLLSWDDAWQRVLERPNLPALPIPHSGLQEKIMGFRPGEITTLVGGTGTGKTTTCKEWAHDMARGAKLGYVALEESFETTALGLVSVAVSRPLHFGDANAAKAADVQAAASLLRDRVVLYDHHGSIADDNLLAKIRFMVKGEGCQVVVLDHLSIVVSGLDERNDERKTIDRLMTRLASLVQECRFHLLVVSHLSRQEGKPHEEGRQVSLSHLRGSHGIAQLSHNVVALERDQQSDTAADVTNVRVLKCRFTGRTGFAGTIVYDPITGRQREPNPFQSAPDSVDPSL
jgi:twinkle protein